MEMKPVIYAVGGKFLFLSGCVKVFVFLAEWVLDEFLIDVELRSESLTICGNY
jgi:hypothetical protein